MMYSTGAMRITKWIQGEGLHVTPNKAVIIPFALTLLKGNSFDWCLIIVMPCKCSMLEIGLNFSRYRVMSELPGMNLSVVCRGVPKKKSLAFKKQDNGGYTGKLFLI